MEVLTKTREMVLYKWLYPADNVLDPKVVCSCHNSCRENTHNIITSVDSKFIAQGHQDPAETKACANASTEYSSGDFSGPQREANTEPEGG